MPITETKIEVRPNTSQPFFNEISELPPSEGVPVPEVVQNLLTAMIPLNRYVSTLRNDGTMPQLSVSYSADGLVRTHVRTFANLEIYSQVETLYGIEVDAAYKEYYSRTGFVAPPPPEGTRQYVQSGIDAPFTCTITYTYDPDTISTTYPNFDMFVNVLESSDKLISLTNTGTQIIAVFQHDNSEDFTENHWKDYPYVEKLAAAGVTRTIVYAMV